MSESVRLLLEGVLDYSGALSDPNPGLEATQADHCAAVVVRPDQCLPLIERADAKGLAIHLRIDLGPMSTDEEWQNGLEAAARTMNAAAALESDSEATVLSIGLPPTGDLATFFRDLRGFREGEVFLDIPAERDLVDTLAAIAETEWIGASISAQSDPLHLAEFLLSCADLEMTGLLTGNVAALHADAHSPGLIALVAGLAVATSQDYSRREFADLLRDAKPQDWIVTPRSISFRGIPVTGVEIEAARCSLSSVTTESLAPWAAEFQSLMKSR